MRKWRLAVLGLAVVAATGWWVAHRKPHVTTPPEVPIEDPAVSAAVSKLRTAVLANPTDAAAWGRLGQTYLANGFLAPARACLAEAGRLAPGDPQWPYLEAVGYLQDDPVAAAPCWQRAAECPGTDERSATARLRWAEWLLAADRHPEAERVLREVMEKQPANARGHFNLGLLAVARNDTSAAIEHFRQCADNASAQKKSSAHLARLLATDKPAEAAEFARRVETLPPDSEWPDPFLESILPYTVGRVALFIQAERQQQQGNTRQAFLLYREVIQQFPEDARAYTKLGMLYAELGNYAAAEETLLAGLTVAPDTVQAHYFLAVSLFHQAERLGFGSEPGLAKLRGTVAAARRAIELKPDHGFAHVYLGLALNGLGKRDEGLKALMEAVKCTPEATDPHLHLGLALLDLGRTKEAIATLERATRLASPTDSRARRALDRARAVSPAAKAP